MNRILPILLLAFAACLGKTPEQRAEDALGDRDHCLGEDGPDDECGSPFHRPGQPCLVCHSEAHSPGDDIFMVAGTIYERPTDAHGLEGAQVHIADSAGHHLTVPTNATGNFYVMRSEDGDTDIDEGGAEVPYDLVFPLEVEVEHGPNAQVMRSRIWREGSCAGCHEGAPGTDTLERVFVLGADQ